MQDNLWKNYGHLSEIELASTCKDLLQESQEQMDKPEMFIKLEGVSKVRFSLVAGAQLLVNFINRKDAQTEEYKMRLLGYFNVMDTFCSNKNYEDGADFLVKVLVLKYGKTYLDDIFQSELGDFAWIYPERLRKQVQIL